MRRSASQPCLASGTGGRRTATATASRSLDVDVPRCCRPPPSSRRSSDSDARPAHWPRSPASLLAFLPPPPSDAPLDARSMGEKKPKAPSSWRPARRPSKGKLQALAALLFVCALHSLSRVMRRERRPTSDRPPTAADERAGEAGLAIRYEEVPSGRPDVLRYAALDSDDDPVSVRAWMEAVASSSGASAASALSDLVAASPFASVLFETPGTNWVTSGKVQFEFALVNEPTLARFAESDPDRYAFEEHFRRCRGGSAVGGGWGNKEDGEEEAACAFDNLGKDARLVAPLPLPGIGHRAYAHLASFVRGAPRSQVAEFWRRGAHEYLETLKSKEGGGGGGAKTWFSTNGMGVAWLHLRLDARPKYYSYGPFARAS
ncbi:hypothetical protein ACHAWF_004375 [Thalassiosira exigua]